LVLQNEGDMAMKVHLPGVITLLAFCMVFAPAIFAQDGCTHPRIISVTGTAEVAVTPDEVTLTLGVDSRDKELALAKKNNDERVKKLLALAHSAGVDAKNIQTSALTIEPEYSDEKIPKFLAYEMSQVVTITLTDRSKYEDLMTSALNTGVNRVLGIRFFVAEPRKYREEARLKAVRAAREKATAMAAELGQTIGKPWEVTEDTGVDASYLTVNSFSANYGGLSRQRDDKEESTIAGGEVTIRASVRASFQLE
jgi:uncharacterized protein YggE